MNNVPERIEAIEAFASETIGDGKTPDLFFVVDRGTVITITRNFEIALREWRSLARRYPLMESTLENRKDGTLASVEPIDDSPNAKLRV